MLLSGAPERACAPSVATLVECGCGKGAWRGSFTEGFEVLDGSGHKLVCGLGLWNLSN